MTALRNIEAEQTVIGAMFIDPTIVPEVRALVSADDFSNEHREIFESVCRVHDAGETADEVTVTSELRARGRLEAAGGASAVCETVMRIPTAANHEAYCRIVRTCGRLRRLRDAAMAVSLACAEAQISSDAEARQWFGDAQTKLVDATSWSGGSRNLTTRDLFQGVMKFAEERCKQSGEMIGWPTGFPTLDEKLSGLRPQRLHIVAAKTGVGKTAMALSMARAAATRGAKTYVVSLEMGTDELGLRLASQVSGVPATRIETGTIDAADMSRLDLRLTEALALPILWPVNPPTSIAAVRGECQLIKRKQGLDLLIVDYLQLVSGHGRSETREREVAEVSRGLKLLAAELDIAVVALSQLNRKQDRHAAPELADLRDSGSIEQDANAVIFLWTDNDDLNAPVNWKLAKNRGGFLGQGTLSFKRAIQRFEEVR